jgi:hypothetical protein
MRIATTTWGQSTNLRKIPTPPAEKKTRSATALQVERKRQEYSFVLLGVSFGSNAFLCKKNHCCQKSWQ